VAVAARTLKESYPAAAVARALKIRRQRLYPKGASVAAAVARAPRPGDEELAVEIRKIMDEEPTYGYRRVTFRLRRTRRVNKKRIQRLMRERGWRSLGYQGRRGKRRRLPVGKSIHAERSNERWGTDWTCFWAYDCWLWFVVVVDHCDRDTPGWRTVESPTAQAAEDALEMAVEERRGEYLGDLEVRSDGGPQFTAHRYGRAIERLGLRHTVTPARSPNYNPFAEAFFGSFKEEFVYQSHWTSRAQAKDEAEAWMVKYRSLREQAALGGLAPLEYREQMLRKLAA